MKGRLQTRRVELSNLNGNYERRKKENEDSLQTQYQNTKVRLQSLIDDESRKHEAQKAKCNAEISSLQTQIQSLSETAEQHFQRNGVRKESDVVHQGRQVCRRGEKGAVLGLFSQAHFQYKQRNITSLSEAEFNHLQKVFVGWLAEYFRSNSVPTCEYNLLKSQLEDEKEKNVDYQKRLEEFGKVVKDRNTTTTQLQNMLIAWENAVETLGEWLSKSDSVFSRCVFDCPNPECKESSLISPKPEYINGLSSEKGYFVFECWRCPI